MKKLISLLLGAALLSSTFVVATSAAPVRGDSRITIPQVETMVLDGVRGPEYGTEYFIIDQLHYPAVGVDSASTGRAWFAWSYTHLYGFIEVVDSTPNVGWPAGFFRQDGVEIYFDWNNAILASDIESAFGRVTIGAAPFEQSSDYQATLRRAGISDVRAAHAYAEIRQHLDFYTAWTDTGYVIEFALCLDWALQHASRPGEPFAIGREIGVEIMLNDNQYPAHGGDRAWSAIRGYPFPVASGAGPAQIGAVMVLGAAVVVEATPTVTPPPAAVTPAPNQAGPTAPGDEVDKVNIPDTSDVVTITFGVAIAALLVVAVVARKKVTE